MSDDFVNQLTLNFLISKNQLQKLNKKVKENSDEIKVKEIQKYRKRITAIFNNLLDNEPPDDLLFEVKLAFDTFIDKSIYYFKARDNSFKLENERLNKDIIQDDIDFEKEENDEERDGERDGEGYEDGERDGDEEGDERPQECNIIVKNKYTNRSHGVDDIQKLPLNWFENLRQNYKQNNIIPRKKDVTITEQAFSDVKKKI